MFSKILSSLKGSKNTINTELEDKISKMSMIDMRVYVNGGLNDFEVDGLGLNEVVKKLMSVNEETAKNYLEMDAMDSKKKKALDLIILILGNKKISITAVESVEIFLNFYAELIKKYDTDNKQIYESRIKKAMSLAIDKINMEAKIINVMEMTK